MSNELIISNLTPKHWELKNSPEFQEFKNEALKLLIPARKKITKKDFNAPDDSTETYKNFDYGWIANRKTLYQRGAEKLRQHGNLIPAWKHEIIANNSTFAVISECTLFFKGTPIAMGAGGGTGFKDFDFNKAVQMSDIRSFKKAIRLAYGIIDEYTQDIEEKATERKTANPIGKKKVVKLSALFKKLNDEQKKEIRLYVKGMLAINDIPLDGNLDPMNFISVLTDEQKKDLVIKVEEAEKIQWK